MIITHLSLLRSQRCRPATNIPAQSTDQLRAQRSPRRRIGSFKARNLASWSSRTDRRRSARHGAGLGPRSCTGSGGCLGARRMPDTTSVGPAALPGPSLSVWPCTAPAVGLSRSRPAARPIPSNDTSRGVTSGQLFRGSEGNPDIWNVGHYYAHLAVIRRRLSNGIKRGNRGSEHLIGPSRIAHGFAPDHQLHYGCMLYYSS